MATFQDVTRMYARTRTTLQGLYIHAYGKNFKFAEFYNITRAGSIIEPIS